MKLLTIISILITCSFALAESDADLVKKGCLPRTDATNGNISGYDCNVTQSINGKMEMQNLRNAKKVQLKNISADDVQINQKTKCDGLQAIVSNDFALSSLEIQQGDVIKSFDGQPITSIQQSLELQKKLAIAGKHEIVIDRNSNLKSIKYEITQAFKLIE